MKYAFKILIINFVFLTCYGIKQGLCAKNNKQDVILIITDDYTKNVKKKKGSIYNIRKYVETEDLFCFEISSMNHKIFPTLKDSVGSKSSYFPSRFVEKQGALFIWCDSTIAISKEMIRKLNKYKIIDSTSFKIEMGQLSEENWPVIKSDDSKKSTFYYVCKQNIFQFKKIKSNQILASENYPVLKCK